MEKLFERILNVIRKPEDESGFSTLIEDVGEKPEILTNNFTTTYVFCNSGFVISFFKKNSKRSTMAYFHLNTAMVKAGTINRYSNDLTAGIQFGDEHSDVEKKLGMTPISSKKIQGRTKEDPMDQYVDYDLNPFTLECVFAGETKKLDMVSMRIDFPEVDLSE